MLKSNQKHLQKRGLATADDISELENSQPSELIKLLHSDCAVTRTASAYNLFPSDELTVTHLLEQLSAEKCLYTKIAICESLEKGNRNTARQMTRYLGKIGNNQHKVLPQKTSAKKSYPLPRDIIARSLGKMDTSVLPVLLDVLKIGDEVKISEVLDAIGFMTFYHPEIATDCNAQAVNELFRKYENSTLIIWKSIVCLSAFPLPQSVAILQGFISKSNLLGEEANRSLCLISPN